jgi:hypothetical protein
MVTPTEPTRSIPVDEIGGISDGAFVVKNQCFYAPVSQQIFCEKIKAIKSMTKEANGANHRFMSELFVQFLLNVRCVYGVNHGR